MTNRISFLITPPVHYVNSSLPSTSNVVIIDPPVKPPQENKQIARLRTHWKGPNDIPFLLKLFDQISPLVYEARKREKLTLCPYDPTIDFKRNTDQISPLEKNAAKLSSGQRTNGSWIYLPYSLTWLGMYNLSPSPYIAISSPSISSLPSFLQLIQDHKIQIIVTIGEDYPSYLPKPKEGSICTTLFQLIYVNAHPPISLSNGWTIYQQQYTLTTQQKKDPHTFWEIHIGNWKNGTAGNEEALFKAVELLNEMRCRLKLIYDPLNRNYQPILVHCLAGLGRTGLFIGCDHLFQHAFNPAFASIETTCSAHDLSCQLRLQRPGLGNDFDQYVMLHRFAAFLKTRF